LLPALAAALLGITSPPDARAQQHGHHHAAPSQAERHVHPEPRPGIDAAGVLPARQVKERARDAYAAARRIPQVLDGIYCHCDCLERHPELHSLLDCFKSQMAANCGICQAQARLALELHRQGKTLEQIRQTIDAEHGG
ncbi:MAG TPA: PCYCGC motif-containing (lipo)protein, partial [Longimicrobium sp.]|nr:PCYCGC motif-containing (lipo)protein [Longimicrobium sp.]